MILIYCIIYFLYLFKCWYVFLRKVKNVVNFFIIKLRNIIRNSKKLNIIDRIDNDPKNSFLKLYLKFFLNHGMGWDGTKNFRPIPSHGTKKNFWSHPIPSHDFKKHLSHTMGCTKKKLSHGMIFFVPSHSTRSPAMYILLINIPFKDKR